MKLVSLVQESYVAEINEWKLVRKICEMLISMLTWLFW